MSDGVGIDRVGGAAPSLNLLDNALCVGGGENAELGRVTEGVRQVIQECRDSLCDADGSEDAGAE